MWPEIAGVGEFRAERACEPLAVGIRRVGIVAAGDDEAREGQRLQWRRGEGGIDRGDRGDDVERGRRDEKGALDAKIAQERRGVRDGEGAEAMRDQNDGALRARDFLDQPRAPGFEIGPVEIALRDEARRRQLGVPAALPMIRA